MSTMTFCDENQHSACFLQLFGDACFSLDTDETPVTHDDVTQVVKAFLCFL